MVGCGQGRGVQDPVRYARLSGRDPSDWSFYLALVNFKIGVPAEGTTHRALHGAGDVENTDPAVQATPRFIAAARRALAGG